LKRRQHRTGQELPDAISAVSSDVIETEFLAADEECIERLKEIIRTHEEDFTK
jgi:hypothetical protein